MNLPLLHAVLVLLLLGAPLAADTGRDAADSEAVLDLHEAARKGQLTKVRELLDAGIPVDAGNDYDATALIYAAKWGHADVVRLLLERGADVKHRDTFVYGFDALGVAAQGGHADIVVLLVEHGADAASAIFTILENPDALRALLVTRKVPEDTLVAALSLATLDENEVAVAVLEKAGARLPEPSTHTIAPELLATYAGTYAFEESAGFQIRMEVANGELVVHVPGQEPMTLEALDDASFQPRQNTFAHIRMEVEDGKTAAVLKQANRPSAMRFLRVEEKPSTPAAEPVPAETPAPPADDVPAPTGVAQGNWTGFRGPGTAGTAQGKPPITWNVEDGTNVLWKTAVPGRSHASPVVWGDKIFIATAVYGGEDIAFRTGLYGDPDYVETDADYSWRLVALDRASGKKVWEQVAHEGRPRAMHHIKATQFNATPVTDGQRIVAVVGSEGLFCWDLDGKLLWHQDMGKLNVGWFYDAGFEWGHASSPILHDGRVIVQVDRDRDPYIAAYHLEDGSLAWHTERDNIPSWGTPALLHGQDTVEVVTNGSRKIRGYDAATGRELWSLGPHSEVTVGSVVTGHGLAYVVGNWAPIRAIYAIRPGGRGDISLAEGKASNEHVAWHHPRGGTYTPTPLVYGDHFYTLKGNGILAAYEAKTGERIFQGRVAGRGGAAFSASPVAAAGRLYAASEDGDVYVVRHARELDVLATNAMGEVIMATPAITGNVLIVRTLENVYAIGEPSPENEG